MVTIVLNKYKLLNKIGIGQQKLEDLLFNLKSEIKPVDESNIEIEINADRLDLLSSDGIARAIKGLLEKELGEAKYDITDTEYKLIVDNVRTRPYALAAVIYNAKIDLQELIQFQEKLHSTIGRKRKKVAIGIHDLKKIDSKRIEYREVPLSYKFIPLYEKEELTISEVLEKTEQGKLYGNISISNGVSPAIVQEDGEVLSIPPIINSDKTKLDESTKDLFIDVTGTSFEAVAQTLDIIVSNLAEAGGTIGRVKVIKTDNSFQQSSPLLIHKIQNVREEYANKILGIKISEEEICKHITRMRMNCNVENGIIRVTVPQYRVDIINEIDIVEDIAMSIGYNNLEPSKYISTNYGSYDYLTLLERKMRELSIGAGFVEVFNFVLIKNEKILDSKYVKILNPISEEYNAVRNSLIPILLDFLSKNQHAKFPIRIFETGDVVIYDSSTDTGFRNDKRAAYAIMDNKVSYEDVQAPIHYILKTLGIEVNYKEENNDIFIEGRSASIVYENEKIGVIGEINPDVLIRFGIEYPTVIAELYITEIAKKLNKR
ncbi:phenylalanine--tRNA ligase subunit beta [Saccharolobus solfataricus]|uniref:Phenylalanine--tRNA ligase beta subunit n=3 Tax=Saccharolobus solfataricus TaxID=2287 RepID=SYFB_SACS2|nr:phenylalanine--tRNA ligase subunit beta [Saccharolobus solfataricus]P95960.1 RecName: Full=Phenylalanine--tRNA ligase beta subunit; AltName: Full=Phenylalanyl-tRNA synthetase beta subunit; Short=PheRS [Saccharolobus solfataricus P2]AAK40457.1 Phenylalanyl-tRNA synthetase beta subunit (pheT) [Saccharolobus solfataricus P2]AKA73442.1 phenylalanine--tRNA ligase subunit beta [Saccharolobus solfataricus]AKA76140.1 phenylalanine--tRNA ligase subunit beta [Saccharolobus solfataricus]AKA78832.1 phe